MKFSPIPDLRSNRRLVLAALVVTAIVICVLCYASDLDKTLGDSDDAMRLVLVRDLMSGRGWYDQWVSRLQPPVGTYMHWSRLLDGALGAMTWLFRLVMRPAAAETATRWVWPLIWILPTVICALSIARRLGGGAGVFVCAVILVINPQIYEQFRPGRVDHHNIQILMIMIAAAGAMAGAHRARWAWLAGTAAALGLAIGVEALVFQALIAASYGLRAALDRQEARPARHYAIALAGAALVFYGAQTPPWRWWMSFCDAIGWNLVLAIEIGCVGLAAVTTWGMAASVRSRLAMLTLVGVVAVSVYLVADPSCIKGPLAAVDPRLRPFWFDRVQELQSWPRLLRTDRDTALATVTAAMMSLAGAAFVLVRERGRLRFETGLACVAVMLAAVAASQAYRMQDYVFWLGFPVLAAAVGLAAIQGLGGLLLPTLVASLILSPFAVGVALTKLNLLLPVSLRLPAKTPQIDEHCFDAAVYRPLAALAPGVVVAEIDLGPFILAHTGNSVLAAPYHRMAWGDLASHAALGAPSAVAEPRFRALKADYLVSCPTNPLRVGANSVEADVRHGRIPAWLRRLSSKGQTLQIYQIRPATLVAGPSL